MNSNIALHGRLLKTAIFTYFKTWWLPIAAYIIPIWLYALSGLLKRDSLYELAVNTVFTIALINILALMVQLFYKHWFKALIQLVVMVVIYALTVLIIIVVAPDHYGAHKNIPNNIEILVPADFHSDKPKLEDKDFIVTQGQQPGMYEYHTTYHPDKSGLFFIKAFEVISNDRLSENHINFESKLEVTDLDKPLYSGAFVIYEGSWGDKYAARIELWHKPQGEAAYQVMQKNYVVEGWMR